MVSNSISEPGIIIIDGVRYRLGRNENGIMYRRQSVSDPPYTSGEPSILSEGQLTWHLGGFKSFQGIPGTSEYGQNTDGRWPFKLIPAPLINEITIDTTNTGRIRAIISSQSTGLFQRDYIWVSDGSSIWRIDESDTVVLSTSAFGARKFIEWEGNLYALDLAGSAPALKELTTINAGGPDTWDVTGDVTASDVVIADNRLIKINNDTIKNIVLGLDPQTEANWADSISLPEDSGIISSYEKTVIAATQKGLYAMEDDGTPVNVASRVLNPNSLPLSLYTIEPFVYLVASNGVFRWQPGIIESVGLEQEEINQSPITGICTSIRSHGKWIYMKLTDFFSDTFAEYILVGHERTNEPGFGPITWDTLLYTTPTNFNSLYAPIEIISTGGFLAFKSALAFDVSDGTDLIIGYCTLPDNGGIPPIYHEDYRFAPSGTRYTIHYRWDDFQDKDFLSFEIRGRNLSANVKWAIAYRIDSGSWVTTDIDSTTMEITDNELHRFTLAKLTDATAGFDIQYRLTYTSNSSTVAGEIIYFSPHAMSQSEKRKAHQVFLNLDADSYGMNVEDRSTYGQIQDLETLEETHAAVEVTFPWGETINAMIKSFQIVQVQQDIAKDHRYLAEIQILER